jgi:hypothetical protein
VDLTTLARVKVLMEIASTDTSKDVILTRLILAYSAQFEAYLDRHAETKARTEVYFLRRYSRLLSLRGAPCTAPTSVKYTLDRDFVAATALTSGNDYVVDTDVAMIRFLFSTNLDPGYVEVVYTGGMATNTTNFVAAFPAVAEAADQQIAYHQSRISTPGGSLTVGGEGRTFVGQLDLLEGARRVLDVYRRHYL